MRRLPIQSIPVFFILLAAAPAAGAEAPPKQAEIHSLTKQAVDAGNPDAALRLAEMGSPAVDALRLATKKPNKRFAAICAWAIHERPNREAHRPAVALLTKLLPVKEQVAAYWAARALGAIGDRKAAEPLAAMLPEKPNYYWEQNHGKRAVLKNKAANNVKGPVEAPADMPNVRTVYASLLALGDLGGPKAEATLAKAAKRPTYLIRHAAAIGLGRMKAASQLETLRTMALEDPVLIVRDAAAEAVQRIEGTWSEPNPPLPAMPDAMLLIKTANRSDANLGFRDAYFHDKTPWYHGGENLFVLSPVWPREKQKLTNLTKLTGGAVQGPELSYDGKKILFAMRRDDTTDGFHLFEMNLDGTGLKQLTDGNCNDVDPAYLPDGRIVFCSDRAGYHEYYHQERSRVIHVMNADGSDVQQVTFNPNQDYEPLPLQNGFVVYSSYRFYAQDGSPGPVRGEYFLQRIETTLRTIRPDGSGDDLFYGAMRGSYYTPLLPTPDSLQYQGKHPRGHLVGVAVSQQKEMADGRIACITPAGLTMIDPGLNRTDCERPVYPELLNLAGGEEVYIHNHDQMNPHGRFTTPYPAVSPNEPGAKRDDWLYVSHAPWYDLRRNGYGIYLFNTATRRKVLVYDDPQMADIDPVPVYSRPVPKILRSVVKPGKDTGRIYCVSVFNSDLPYDHSTVKYVRVIAARQQGLTINANASFRTRILGQVPLEEDGSFYVEVPADTPLRFILLDADEQTIIHESEFNYVRPGETKGCIGCHEPKDDYIEPTLPMATQHPPARMHEKRGDLIYQGVPSTTYGTIVRE
jgi:hydrazine synthase alpha subunit-like protein/HEAT repeat protein/WD40 repeat protein/PBS lyase HEAT-like repeat-containing protein